MTPDDAAAQDAVDADAPDVDVDDPADADAVTRDVVVVGGGPAGCSTAVFTARYGLATVVFDRGASSIDRCAYLANFLGFPAGVDVGTFVDLAHAHVEESGGTVVEDNVQSVARTRTSDGGFRVETADGRSVAARFVVAAAKYDAAYLGSLDDPALFAGDEDGSTELDAAAVAPDGSTPVEGLYVAGPLGGSGDQAVTAAGHGATVARAIVERLRAAEGYWSHFAELYDWLRKEAELAGDWADPDHWRDWFDEEAPADLDDETRERLREQFLEERFAAYLDAETVAERRREGHRALAEHLDDDALLDVLDDETVLAAVDDDRIRAYTAALPDAEDAQPGEREEVTDGGD